MTGPMRSLIMLTSTRKAVRHEGALSLSLEILSTGKRIEALFSGKGTSDSMYEMLRQRLNALGAVPTHVEDLTGSIFYWEERDAEHVFLPQTYHGNERTTHYLVYQRQEPDAIIHVLDRQVLRAQLFACDYRWMNRYDLVVGCERKMLLGDLLSSLRSSGSKEDARLTQQAAHMKQVADVRFLLVEDDEYLLTAALDIRAKSGESVGYNYASILLQLISLQLEYGLMPLFVPYQGGVHRNTGTLINRLRAYTDKTRHTSTEVKDTDLGSSFKGEVEPEVAFLASRVKSWDVVAAKSALQHAGTLRRFFSFSEQQMLKIPHWGPIRVKKIQELLDKKVS